MYEQWRQATIRPLTLRLHLDLETSSESNKDQILRGTVTGIQAGNHTSTYLIW